jgi:hypothetical protein
VTAWRRSGLALERFAVEHGLVPQRLRRWRDKVTPGAAPAVTFVPVEVRAVAAEPVEIRMPSGIAIRLPALDEAGLVRLVRALETAC